MDRVLIAFDQIQQAGHLEMTLRKVGFDVETITNEFNLSEKLLSFNPDIIIARGQGPKLSAFNIGKKIKDNLKYSGKVILVLGADQKFSPEDLDKIKVDLLLFEPMGALKLATNILNIASVRKEAMLDRLLRMAETDTAFRTQEQAYLVSNGQDLDREIIKVQGNLSDTDDDLLISDQILEDFGSRKKITNLDVKKNDEPEQALTQPSVAVEVDATATATATEIQRAEDYKKELQNEIVGSKEELSLRIDTYNHQIKNIDQDLKKGLSRRQTKKINQKLRAEFMVDPGQETLDSLDTEKQKFAQALFKKK